MWRSGSKVFASITRGLLARPRPCGLQTPPANGVNRRTSNTSLMWVAPHIFNAGGPHARGPRQATPGSFGDVPQATWQHHTPI
jgi:hypothetical protein